MRKIRTLGKSFPDQQAGLKFISPLDLFTIEFLAFMETNPDRPIIALPLKLSRLLQQLLKLGYSFNQIAAAACTDHQTIVDLVRLLEADPRIILKKYTAKSRKLRKTSSLPSTPLQGVEGGSNSQSVPEDAQRTALLKEFEQYTGVRFANRESSLKKFCDYYEALIRVKPNKKFSDEMKEDLERIIADSFTEKDISDSLVVFDYIGLWWLDRNKFVKEKKLEPKPNAVSDKAEWISVKVKGLQIEMTREDFKELFLS